MQWLSSDTNTDWTALARLNRITAREFFYLSYVHEVELFFCMNFFFAHLQNGLGINFKPYLKKRKKSIYISDLTDRRRKFIRHPEIQ